MAVVIVNYRTADLTIASVESVLASHDARPRVIVIDNASGDDSVERLLTRFGKHDGVTIVARATNDGFCGGNNVGVTMAAEAGARYAFLLNSDATVAPDCITLLAAEAQRDPTVALVNPLIFVGGTSEPWFAGARFSMWRGRPVHNSATSQMGDPADIPFATGCAMLVAIDALHGENAFDPSLFAYAEDLDLSLRVRRDGRRIRYVPAAHAWHFEGSSHRFARGQSLRLYLATRNSLRVAARHARWYHWITLAPMLSVDVVGRFAAVALRDRDVRAFAAVLRGALHAITGGRHPIEPASDTTRRNTRSY
ncbi:MAG: glycosyltransferase [Solirubrobacteraceae bacterium]